MSAVAVLDCVPLAKRIEIARDAGSHLVFSGATLEELHQLLEDARDVERAFYERSVAVVDAGARAQAEISMLRTRLIDTWAAVIVFAAALAGGLLP